MKNKNYLSKIKNCISVMLIVSLLAGTLAGCAFPFGNDVDNVISREDVQADVDALLDQLYGTVAAEEDNDNDDLSKETVEVDNNIALGKLITSDSEYTKYTESFNILEIVPNPKYAVMGYLIGGCEPLDSYALDAMGSREIGIIGESAVAQPATGQGALSSYTSSIFGSDDGNNPFVVTQTYDATGYMEKIAFNDRYDKNGDYPVGGTYALKYEMNETDRKRGIKRFTDAIFVSEYTNVTKNGDYGTAFCKMNRIDTGETEEVFVYDEEGNRVQIQDIDDYGQPKVDENGNPVMIDKTEVVPIYDFKLEYRDGEPYVDRDAFCWIWHDIGNPDDFSMPSGSNYYSYADFKNEFKDKDIAEIEDGTRIYFTAADHFRKTKTYNNEMFLLHCLGLKTNNNGLFRWQPPYPLTDNNAYDYIYASGIIDSKHIEALDEYYVGQTTRVYGTNLINNTLSTLKDKKIKVRALTPSQVAVSDVDEADLIVICSAQSREDQIYGITRKLYCVEHDETNEDECPPTKDVFDFDNNDDLSFYAMRAIYEKVITNKVALMCNRNSASNPYSSSGFSNCVFTRNIGRLMLLLFCFYKEDGTVFSAKEVGSDFFASYYIRKLADACHAVSLRHDDNNPSIGDGRVLPDDPVYPRGRQQRPCDYFYVIEEDSNYITEDERNNKIGWIVAKKNGELGTEKKYYEDWNEAFKDNFPCTNNSYGAGESVIYKRLFSGYYDDQANVPKTNIKYRYRTDFENNKRDGNIFLFDDNNLFMRNLGYSNSDLKNIIQSSIKNKDVGSIDLVGAIIDKNEYRNAHNVENGAYYEEFKPQNRGDSVQNHTYEEEFKDDNNRYQFSFMEYTYSEDGKTKQQKVLYLNEYEFELAKDNGLRLYAKVKVQDDFNTATADSSCSNKSNTWSLANENKRKYRVYQINDADTVGEQKYKVCEFEYYIEDTFFKRIEDNLATGANPKLPLFGNDNLFTVTVEITKTGTDGSQNLVATGSDSVRIVIRDMFDLD